MGISVNLRLSINPSASYLSITSPLSFSITYLPIPIIYHTGCQGHEDRTLSDSTCMGPQKREALRQKGDERLPEAGIGMQSEWRVSASVCGQELPKSRF